MKMAYLKKLRSLASLIKASVDARLVFYTNKAVLDLVGNGFCHGVLGNRSDAFIKRTVDSIVKDTDSMRAFWYYNHGNLAQYCGWTREQITWAANNLDMTVVDDPHLVIGFDIERN